MTGKLNETNKEWRKFIPQIVKKLRRIKGNICIYSFKRSY
jgi:hypothetical protein